MTKQNNGRYEGLEFDKYVAQYYISKIDSSKARNLEFSLTFLQVRNMMRAKRCQLTGAELTHSNGGGAMRHTDLTIDRIDCTKGYVKGNVMAVCNIVNSLKGAFEGKYRSDFTALHSMSKVLKKKGL